MVRAAPEKKAVDAAPAAIKQPPPPKAIPSIVPAARTPSTAAAFVCVDFVCVNRTHTTPNLFEYSSSAVVGLQSFPTFRECVERCIATPSAAVSTSVAAAASIPAATPQTPPTPPPPLVGTGLVHVGNRSLDDALADWISQRHDKGACSTSTPVYFAPTSPNGIGNKLMAIVMAFHMALMQNRRLIVSDWPPRTLDVSYPLDELLQPSACQALFDKDKSRPKVEKCTVISCPLRTRSAFRNAYTQPHWAHMSPLFLDLPTEWAHLDWLTWWRAITQYLLRPGPKLLNGLATQLGKVRLLCSPPPPNDNRLRGPRLKHASVEEHAEAASSARGFAVRFARGVASWGAGVRRPLIGVHVRLGDGCWDSKRGGCKYVRSFETILTRLRQAGITSGTIFLATDNSTIATQAVSKPVDGFEVLALGEDRKKVEKSHAKGDRRREGDELLHLQLLDLALLSQTDVLAGVFGSTFVKTALQLGNAASYASLDTFPWCPLLRCYWGWRDMCHNCELCYNSGGGGEACNNNGYHTAVGLLQSVKDLRQARAPFRNFIKQVTTDFKCRPFAEHPLAPTMYDQPVVGAHYSLPLPKASLPAETSCADGGTGGDTACSCGFRRFKGVDNAVYAEAKPAYGYGTSFVPLSTLRKARVARGGRKDGRETLEDCERACCAEVLCHSVIWRANTSTCVAALAIAHGARKDDWCWHPTHSEHAITSIRLPSSPQVQRTGRTWEKAALNAASEYLRAPSLVRRGVEPGPKLYGKSFHTPVGHSHPMERHIRAAGCEAPRAAGLRAYEVSDVAAGAAALSSELKQCPAPPTVNRASRYPKWRPR